MIASSWVWARLLQRLRGGRPLLLLNGLLAVAAALPLLAGAGWARSRDVIPLALTFLSVQLYGGALSVVASTTALVRDNTPPTAWPAGTAGFTTVFAVGQIIGSSVVGGWIADESGALARGFAFSAAALALGSVLAGFQRPVQG